LSESEILNLYRVGVGKYYWFVNATDNADATNESEWREFSVTDNRAPNLTSVSINSTDGSNRTAQDLNCFTTLSDPEGDSMNVTVWWFNNSQEVLRVDYNNSYANGTLFVATLSSGNTTKGESWSCGLETRDSGGLASGQKNSSSLTILNTPPVVTLDYPSDGAFITNRTPTFNWTYQDDDGDTLTFEFNLTCYAEAGGSCGGGVDDKYVTGLTTNSYTPSKDLQFLYDNGYYYNWSVRANDSEADSGWTADNRVNIQALIQLVLNNSVVEFGTMQPGDVNDTTDNSPQPFVLENQGNVFVNVTINASDIWQTASNPTQYYQFKADNYTAENNSFDPACSVLSFTNMPNTSSPTLAICLFNYTDASDMAEVDVRVEVPPTEPPGARSSQVIFTGELAE
ncbi:hypothetical protein D6817_04130, partial [Candidatus Pacearchaeota archaeon]